MTSLQNYLNEALKQVDKMYLSSGSDTQGSSDSGSKSTDKMDKHRKWELKGESLRTWEPPAPSHLSPLIFLPCLPSLDFFFFKSIFSIVISRAEFVREYACVYVCMCARAIKFIWYFLEVEDF